MLCNCRSAFGAAIKIYETRTPTQTYTTTCLCVRSIEQQFATQFFIRCDKCCTNVAQKLLCVFNFWHNGKQTNKQGNKQTQRETGDDRRSRKMNKSAHNLCSCHGQRTTFLAIAPGKRRTKNNAAQGNRKRFALLLCSCSSNNKCVLSQSKQLNATQSDSKMNLISNACAAYTQYVTLKSLSTMCTLRIRNVCEEFAARSLSTNINKLLRSIYYIYCNILM